MCKAQRATPPYPLTQPQHPQHLSTPPRSPTARKPSPTDTQRKGGPHLLPVRSPPGTQPPHAHLLTSILQPHWAQLEVCAPTRAPAAPGPSGRKRKGTGGPGHQDRAHRAAQAARPWGPAAPRHAFREAAGCVIIAHVWIYLWAFYFVPLIYISVFVPVPYCLDNCGFVANEKIEINIILGGAECCVK